MDGCHRPWMRTCLTDHLKCLELINGSRSLLNYKHSVGCLLNIPLVTFVQVNTAWNPVAISSPNCNRLQLGMALMPFVLKLIDFYSARLLGGQKTKTDKQLRYTSNQSEWSNLMAERLLGAEWTSYVPMLPYFKRILKLCQIAVSLKPAERGRMDQWLHITATGSKGTFCKG